MLAELERKAASCFLCKYMAQDIRKNGKLTETYPEQGLQWMGAPLFPIAAKIDHMILEGLVDSPLILG